MPTSDPDGGTPAEFSIDDLIDQWHAGNDPRPLHEALGMTEVEYKSWVERNQ